MAQSDKPAADPRPDAAKPGSPPRSTRRAFIRHTLGGLAIAVPAVRALAGSTSASAAAFPAAKCSKVYLTYRYHYCSTKLVHTCPTGWVRRCVARYDKYDSSTGAYCGEKFDDEGPCAIS
ncbi:hypothetical protein GCM10009727_84020 [Actinomadura napierensis]|uniref:Twin-arginine translocation signal domain-containing protein n=1 Tax=Actinomadura napierensis TaxID=267854 RepID=A0ABN3AFI6_9ACTN